MRIVLKHISKKGPNCSVDNELENEFFYTSQLQKLINYHESLKDSRRVQKLSFLLYINLILHNRLVSSVYINNHKDTKILGNVILKYSDTKTKPNTMNK